MKPLRGTQLNLSDPLARGLFSCWLFNEGSSDKVYDCVRGVASTTWGAATTWGVRSGGMGIDAPGADGNLYLPADARYYAVSGFSVALSFEFDQLPSALANNQYVLSMHHSAGRYWFFTGNKATDELRIAYVDAGGTTRTASPGAPVSVGRRYNCVLVYNGLGIYLYCNGVFISSSVYGSVITGAAAELRLGHVGSSGYCYDGLCYHLMFWDRGLTDTEARRVTMDPYCMFRRQSPLIVAA